MAIVGSGSVGTIFAHAAHAAGLDTVVCARRATPGLALRVDNVRREIPVPVLTDPRHAFGELLGGSGLAVRQVADFPTAAWRKLLGNAAANPITALTLRRMEVMGSAGIPDLTEALLREVVAVGRAAGADLGPADITATLDFYRGFDGADGTSMLYDRLAGRPMETDLITGVVVRLGRAHGVPTPATTLVHTLLDACAAG
ncbi:ketopantoate reductase C-terminal domain-containing protein [Actinokineospora sp. 24-640]